MGKLARSCGIMETYGSQVPQELPDARLRIRAPFRTDDSTLHPGVRQPWDSRDADIESVLEAVGEEAIGAELVRADVDADAAVAIAIDASRQACDVEGRRVPRIVARVDRR